jgi:SEC-C motif-containing protein
MKYNSNLLCPCNSGKKYKKCCKQIHDGILNPQNALELMISRYSAYAVHRCDYIIQTTHKTNEQFMHDINHWFDEIAEFSRNTIFVGLKILDYNEMNEEAYVTFQAKLQQNGNHFSLTEQSRFIKENEKWYYQQAEIFEEI